MRQSQRCPFCNQAHPILVKGMVMVDVLKQRSEIIPDKGYSFCNCKNIFFTDWSNIDQSIYDDEYTKKYDGELVFKMVHEFIKAYFPCFRDTNGNQFTEVGAANTFVLDYAKEKGWKTCGLDINPNSPIRDKHDHVYGNIEDINVLAKLPNSDVIWASHIFEHFEDPLLVAENLFEKLNPGGYLMIAMPDPWFIPWPNPHGWGHWHIREHHIMWDMDSFIDEMIALGYEVCFSKRNDLKYLSRMDMHILLRRPHAS